MKEFIEYYANLLFLFSVSLFYSFHRMLQDNIRRLEYRKSQVKASLQEYTEKLTQLNHKVQVRERGRKRERERELKNVYLMVFIRCLMRDWKD